MEHQVELPLPPPVYKWGGQREGAGRPKSKGRVGVAHRVRPYHDRHHPVHVTWRVVSGLPSLRTHALAKTIGEGMRAATLRHAKQKTSFRIVHFSIQSNHLHLIAEAGSKTTLMWALRGLGTAIGRRVNGALGRRGQVLADRYHARALTSPREVRIAIVYVLQNHLHHHPSRYLVDENSSARWFNGWERALLRPLTPSPVAAPGTWLAKKGWRRLGLIRFTERPAGRARAG